MITLTSRIRPKHTTRTPQADLDTLSVSEVAARGETYDDAREALDAQVPEGWLLLGLDRS